MKYQTTPVALRKDIEIGTGKSAGNGTPGAVPSGYAPDSNRPLSIYRNMAGCLNKEIKDYLLSIDTWNWHAYDPKSWPCADMDFPDLDPVKAYDVWPFKPDLDQIDWMNLNLLPKGIQRKGYYFGFSCPENFVKMDMNAALVEFEALQREDNASAISAAGFKSKDHLEFMIETAKDIIKNANAEAQELIDKQNAAFAETVNKNVEAVKAGGLLDPIQGISMEDWAAANAKMSMGTDLSEILKILAVEKPVWDAVSAEWMNRMTQDSTMAIIKVYGDAFTNPNMGRFAQAGGTASGPNPAVEALKNNFDEYIKIMCHQNAAAIKGIDAISVLQQYGLTVGDWGIVGMHWMPQINGNLDMVGKMTVLMDKYNAQFGADKAD